MSLLRIAELELYQEIKDEGLRESLRQYAENTRNLQAQIDLLESQVELLELASVQNSENLGGSSSTSTAGDALIYAIALG